QERQAVRGHRCGAVLALCHFAGEGTWRWPRPQTAGKGEGSLPFAKRESLPPAARVPVAGLRRRCSERIQDCRTHIRFASSDRQTTGLAAGAMPAATRIFASWKKQNKNPDAG